MTAADRAEPTLRVLHVLEALTTGCARHVLDLVGRVEGVEHHVVVPTRAAVDRPDDAGIRRGLEDAGAHLHPIAMRRPPIDPRNAVAVLRIRLLARSLGADVVHAHSSIAGALGRAAAVGRRPVVYTPNGLAQGRVAMAIERLIGPLTSRFVAVSPSEADEVERRHLVRPERLVTIANGIDPVAPLPLDLRAVLGIDPGTSLVGTIGRLAPQKAPEVFVAAAAEIARQRRDVHFVLVGDGEHAPDLAGWVRAAGLDDRFHHLRHLPEAARYLASLDVFVLTSRFEGGPYAPLEAMRAGVPVVLTAVTGSRDTVHDGVTGLLVAAEQPSATAGAVLDLLADPTRARALGDAGRRAVHDRFDVGSMAAVHGELYRSLQRVNGRLPTTRRGENPA